MFLLSIPAIYFRFLNIHALCFQVLCHLRPHILASPDVELLYETDTVVNPEIESNSSFRHLGYMILGAGVASLAFLLLASDKMPRSRLVNHILLVIEQMKADRS